MAKDYGSAVGRSVGRAIARAAVGAVLKQPRQKRQQIAVTHSRASGPSASWIVVILLGVFGLAQLVLSVVTVLLVLTIGAWIALQGVLVAIRVGVWIVQIAERAAPRLARRFVRLLRYLAERYW